MNGSPSSCDKDGPVDYEDRLWRLETTVARQRRVAAFFFCMSIFVSPVFVFFFALIEPRSQPNFGNIWCITQICFMLCGGLATFVYLVITDLPVEPEPDDADASAAVSMQQ